MKSPELDQSSRTNIFDITKAPQYFRGSGQLFLTIMFFIFIVLPLGCSSKKKDMNSVIAMTDSIAKKAKEELHEGNLAREEWLSEAVLGTLLIEARIIRDGGVENLPDGKIHGDIRTKLKSRKLIRLYDYNRTLSETLTSIEYKHLMEMRSKYGYAQYFDPETQKL